MRVSLTGPLVFLAALSCSVPAAAKEICDVEFDNLGTLLQEMQSDPRYEVEGSELYLGFVDGLDRKRTWAFTTPANPAHPAVICRSLVQQQDAWVVDTRLVCGGPKQACDRMVADFDDLDKRMAEYLKAKKDEAQE
jgi:hypothetical protein